MKLFSLVCILVLLSSISVFAASNDGLAARWDFDDGSGNILKDSSGNGNDGIINGAKWVKSGNGYALRFNGVDSYVDCGKSESLNITDSVTLEAWVCPDAPVVGEVGLAGKSFDSYGMTFYRGSSYFYISGGGNGTYGPLNVGQWTHLVGLFDGTIIKFFVNGQETGSIKSKFDKINSVDNFFLGCILSEGAKDILSKTASFAGLIDSVKVYNRALSAKEIIDDYNALAAEKGRTPIDTSKFGKLHLQKFIYPEKKQAVLNVDYHWVKPFDAASKILVQLKDSKGLLVKDLILKADSPDDTIDAEFSIDGFKNDTYTLSASLIDANGAVLYNADQSFVLPVSDITIDSPDKKVVSALPEEYKYPDYKVKVSENGGLIVNIDDRSFPVESSYSYPNGGDNTFTTSNYDKNSVEQGWFVKTKQLDKNTYRIFGEGKFYSVSRIVKIKPNRIDVKDTFKNKTDDVIGIILSNHINTRQLPDFTNTVFANPTVYTSSGKYGLGLVALDDVYYLQQRNASADGLVKIIDENFGLDKNASYTIEWAIYPTSTNNYYDFINQIRKDEKINGTAEGSVQLSSRWGPPTKEEMELKNIKYPSVAYLTHVTSTPLHLSLEGWEFMEYPDICARLKKAIDDTKNVFPDSYPMFHVAHSLFLTNRPKDYFPESLLMDDRGNTDHYGPNDIGYYGNYMSKDMFDSGWRWWLFYPTTTNLFGKYMLKAADYMIDRNGIGAKGIWADGYIGGYSKIGYTYDIFDGHSVTIDPKTKKVTRKKANVTLVALPILKAVVKKFNDMKCAFITNDSPGPFSYQSSLDVITSCETGGGDQQPVAALHLGRTVTPLGNPTVIKSEKDIYKDILAKLDLGSLYFFYGEQNFVKEKTLVSYMYPITFDSIHEGYVTGKDRVITKKTGVYGWKGDKALHAVYLYDSCGKQVSNRFISTVDSSGVRTQLQFIDNESAALIKTPITINTTKAVNLMIVQYDKSAISIKLNGLGKVVLNIKNGEFLVKSGKIYKVNIAGSDRKMSVDGSGVLRVPLDLNGEVAVSIVVNEN